ncbi:hypothetical protein EMCRGX_G030790 [Ephydatia muelleri]
MDEHEHRQKAIDTAREELQSLQSLHGSLLALKEMLKSINKDYNMLPRSYQKLSELNRTWQSIVSVNETPSTEDIQTAEK